VEGESTILLGKVWGMRKSETMRAVSRLLLSHPIVCLLAALAAVMVVGVLGPLKVVHAADVPVVEGESFANKPPTGTTVVNDTLFSGGKALKFTTDGTVWDTVNCSTVCDVVLMARAGQSGGTPSFSVNGSVPQAITTSNQVAPEPYTFMTLPAGSNTIQVTASGAGTGHNAFLDVAKFPADSGGGTQSAECADGSDNDGDGKKDYPNDLGCSSPTDNDETDPVAMLPETLDQTPMVNGTVRAIEQVGTNIWLGGKFTQVKQRNGTVVANVSNNLAVFDSETNQYNNIAAIPKLGGTGAEVWDMTIYGDDVLIAGNFSGPTSTQKNLVLVDGATGQVIRWYNAPSLRSALAAPAVGRVYGGGVSLTAFDKDSGTKLWTKAKTTVDTTLYPDPPSPGYRDLELDGSTIWAACACDAVDGAAAKALVKLSTEGVHDTSWLAEADPASWGMSVAKANGALYLGAGGSDYLAKYDKTADGSCCRQNLGWRRDTSGSVQVVEEMEGQLVIGGHFWEVSDKLGDQLVDMVDKCGHGRSLPDLDPNDVCQARKGIVAYSFDGGLVPNWDPLYAGKYSLVWALHVEGARLHTGGEFLTVNGVTQNYYARLSPTSP
jgi:hypothetical protein